MSKRTSRKRAKAPTAAPASPLTDVEKAAIAEHQRMLAVADARTVKQPDAPTTPRVETITEAAGPNDEGLRRQFELAHGIEEG